MKVSQYESKIANLCKSFLVEGANNPQEASGAPGVPKFGEPFLGDLAGQVVIEKEVLARGGDAYQVTVKYKEVT